MIFSPLDKQTEETIDKSEHRFRIMADSGKPRFEADGTCTGYIGSAIDITGQKQREQALSDLIHRLMDLHEAERSWLATELTDNIAQQMALITIGLGRMTEELPSTSAGMCDRVRELSDRVVDLEHDVQVLSRRLRSAKLEYLGIAAAASAYCQDVSTQHHVTVAFAHYGAALTVSRDVSLGLFRVLQEAVNNAVKHADVHEIAVTLREERDVIQLEVADSGKGFDVGRMLRSHTLGLMGMKERLNRVNGEITIKSQPGGGTRILVRVPVQSSGTLV